MDVTKPYKFIGFGAMDVTKPHNFIGLGAMDVTKPYKFSGFGAMGVTKAGLDFAGEIDGVSDCLPTDVVETSRVTPAISLGCDALPGDNLYNHRLIADAPAIIPLF
jgi:hypothetical protein